MADRYTRKDAIQAFDQLARYLGKPTGYGGIGDWRLDYNSAYGGYQIQEIVNEARGITCPMGELRLSTREFVMACRFACRAIENR